MSLLSPSLITLRLFADYFVFFDFRCLAMPCRCLALLRAFCATLPDVSLLAAAGFD